MLIGCEVNLCEVVLPVDEAEVVVEGVHTVEEIIQHRLVELVGQEEVMPIVLLRLQVRGRPHLLALKDILVFLVGEVLGLDDAADIALLL